MSAIELACRLSKPSLVLDKRDVERMTRLSEVQRCFLRERAARFLQQRKRDTILMQYSSDVSPIMSTERFRFVTKNSTIIRGGRSSNEFLVQRVFFADLKGGASIIMEKPLVMQRKTAFAHFCAYRQMVKTPREQGHEGLHVIAHCYDRAVEAPMQRLHRQWQRLHDSQQEDELHAGAFRRLWLQTWFVSVGCCAHDTHGGLKWAILSYYSSKSCMRAAFVAVESLRNGFSLLVKWVGTWLVNRLAFEDWGCDHAHEVYMAFDCDPGDLDTFVDLQLRFRGGRLLVAAKHKSTGGLIDLLLGLLLKTWQFRRWSESRWLSLGGSCRVLARSLFFGIEDLVDFIIGAGESTYCLGGFGSSLTGEVRELILVASFASRPPDAALEIIMHDDRLPKVLAEIDEELLVELQYVARMPDEVWAELAHMTTFAGPVLQSRCIAAATTAVGYIKHKLQEARRGVWALLHGDRLANVQVLAAQSKPEDEVLAKIWELMRLGFPASLVLEGLEALSKVSWSTIPVEQGHSCASGLQRLHKAYGVATLKARSMLLQFKPLLTECGEERQARILQRMLTNIDKKRVSHLTGRQLFLRDLNYIAARRVPGGRVGTHGIAVHKRLMQKHGQRWAALGVAAREKYERRAAQAREEAHRDLQEKRQGLVARAQLLHASSSSASAGAADGPLRVRDCRLAETERVEFEALFASEQFSAKGVEAWRRADEKPFAAPSDVVRRALDSIEVQGREARGWPQWVPVVAWNREFFCDCILKVQEADGDHVYKVAYAMQRPYLVCLSKLVQLETVAPAAPPADYSLVWSSHWDHAFSVVWGEYRWSDEGIWGDAQAVFVLQGAVHIGDEIFADGEWQPFADVAAFFPATPGETSGGGSSRERRQNDEQPCIYELHPWLEEFLRTGEARKRSSDGDSAGPRSKKRKVDNDALSSNHQAAVEAEAVMDALLEKRTELGLGVDDEGRDFVVVLRGGPDLAKRTGKPYDELRAQAVGSAAEQWCTIWHMRKSFSASLSLYGDATAAMLTAAWARRMQFLYELSRHEGPEFVFDREALAAFEEDPEVQRLEDSGGAAIRGRIAAIRGMLPRR